MPLPKLVAPLTGSQEAPWIITGTIRMKLLIQAGTSSSQMLDAELPRFRVFEGGEMFVAMMLMRLFLVTGIATAVMTLALVSYENSLSTREDDQLFLNKAEQTIMFSEQRKLVGQFRWLARLIYVFAAITATLLLASAGLWMWIGLRS
jgi:hypothetical protein